MESENLVSSIDSLPSGRVENEIFVVIVRQTMYYYSTHVVKTTFSKGFIMYVRTYLSYLPR